MRNSTTLNHLCVFITADPLYIHIPSSYPSKLERIPNDSRVDVISIKQTKLKLDMGSFLPELFRGDKVVVSGGDYVGLTGLVARVASDEIHVTLDAHWRTEGVPDELLFNIHDLVKRYDIGDSVAVVRGKEVGCNGIVVAIGDAACCNLPRFAPLRLSRLQTLPPASSPSSTCHAASKRAWRIAATLQVRKSAALRPPARRV